MTKWVFTGRVYNISEFGILDMDICTDPRRTVPSRAHVGHEDGGPWIDVVPHPDDDKMGELWAEVQRKEEFDAL